MHKEVDSVNTILPCRFLVTQIAPTSTDAWLCIINVGGVMHNTAGIKQQNWCVYQRT